MSDLPSDAVPAPAGAPTHDPLLDQPVSRRRATLWNLAFAYASLALVLVRNLGLLPLYTRYIDSVEIGAWFATGGVLGMLTNIDFGLMGVLQQQVAVAYGRKDRERLERAIGTGFVAALLLAGGIGLLSAAASPLVPMSLRLSGEAAARLAWCFAIGALAGAGQLTAFATGGVLRCLQRPIVPGALRMFGELAAVIGTTWWLLSGAGLWSIACGLVLRTIIDAGGNAIVFLWAIRRKLRLALRATWRDAREMLSLSMYSFAFQMTRPLKFGLDAWFVGAALGGEAGARVGGAYALTLRAHETVRLIADQFAASLFPSLAHLHGEGSADHLRRVIIVAFKFQTLLAAVGMGGVMAFNESFVRLFTDSGSNWYAGDAITLLAALWVFALLASGLSFEVLYAMGQFASIARLVWLEVLIRTPLVLLMLWAVGPWGVPAAALATQVVVCNIMLLRGMLRKTGFPVAETLWLLLGQARVAALPLAAGAALLAVGFAAPTRIAFAWQAALFAAVTAAAALALDRDLRGVLKNRGRIAAAG